MLSRSETRRRSFGDRLADSRWSAEVDFEVGLLHPLSPLLASTLSLLALGCAAVLLASAATTAPAPADQVAAAGFGVLALAPGLWLALAVVCDLARHRRRRRRGY